LGNGVGVIVDVAAGVGVRDLVAVAVFVGIVVGALVLVGVFVRIAVRDGVAVGNGGVGADAQAVSNINAQVVNTCFIWLTSMTNERSHPLNALPKRTVHAS
jgi:hypothetical protein